MWHLDIKCRRHHDVSMKATLTLDEDLAEFLKEQARRLGKPFDQVVNETLRQGISLDVGETPTRPYRVQPMHGGFAPGVDPLKLKEILHEEDDERYRKLSGRL